MTGSEEARVVVTTGEALRTEVSAGGHTVVADEPESLGGTDAGPTPYDYLLAALGGCTVMTLRMYADRKGWPLEAVTVRLSQDRIHAKDCGECETEEGRIDRFASGRHEGEMSLLDATFYVHSFRTYSNKPPFIRFSEEPPYQGKSKSLHKLFSTNVVNHLDGGWPV